MPPAAIAPEAIPHKITGEEGLEILDRQARRYLGIPGAEFLEAWKSGKVDGGSDRPEVMRVAMLVPLAG
jgi:hypothetical protein